TTIYQAAEKILAIADLNQTADMALDMLMELFQSVTSAVFIHNRAEHRLELMPLKTVMGNQDLPYWLALPNESTVSNQLVIDYTNPLARSEFLQLFPGFEAIEEHLLPLTVVHLQHQDRYFGFITLSTRMTEQPYSNDDFALLTMLSHSIAIALDNAWMLSKMEAQNQLLDRRLEELMAIQDALRVMRQATNLTEFCSLMANTLKLGMEAQLFAVLIDNGQHLINMYGSDEFCQQSGDQIALIATSTVITSNNGVKLLVVPIQHPGRLHAYLVISEFTNTVLDDGERTHLLDLIAAMLADTLAHLYELHCIEQQGVLDYSLLICHRLQQEIDQLAELGLTPCIIKFQHQEPAVVIRALGRAAMGIVIQPQTGILIGRLPATQLLPLLEPLTNNLVEINELSPEAIFLTAVPSDRNENSSIPKYGAMI
ncbi:MAG: GAF domain-containing protein, partial [Methanomassiliicoccales archaeon]